MEYLTDMVTTVPEGTSPAKVDEMRAAEAVRAAELAKAGHLVRLWRPHSVQANGAALGCSVPQTRQSFEVLDSLPLHIWMNVTITQLSSHPNDPESRAHQATDYP